MIDFSKCGHGFTRGCGALCACGHECHDHAQSEDPELDGSCDLCDCEKFAKPDYPGRFLIEAQWPGLKNKFAHSEAAMSFEDARAEAEKLFEGSWRFRITDQETGACLADEGFDPNFEES